MKKSMALALSLCILSSCLYGCSSEATPVKKVYASDDIEKYNSSILEVCNYEVNNGEVSNTNKIAKTNLDTLKNAYNSNIVNYKVKLDDLDYYLDSIRNKIISSYLDNKYIKENTELDEEEDNKEFIAEQNKYFDLAKIIKDDINRIDKVKDKDFIKYLDLVYDICNRYNALPDNFKNIIPNRGILVYEVESLGGKIDKNFNIEKQKYLYEVKQLTQNQSEVELDDEVSKTYDGEIEPYTGVSDEELGLVETFGSDSPYGRKRGENYLEESNEIETSEEEAEANEVETESSEVETEASETESSEIETEASENEVETSKEVDEVSESRVETSIGDNTYNDYGNNTSENMLNTNAKSLEELSLETDIPIEVYNMVQDGGTQFTVEFNIEDLRNYVSKLDPRLTYESGSWYINLEGAQESGEIDLLGGYYISWIIQKNEPTEFSLTDFIYWDTNGFKVRCVNKSGRMVTLEGYISDDTIFISNITDILDSINPARAYVYNRNDEVSDEDYYEDETSEVVEETSETSEEMSTEDIVEETSEGLEE